MEYHGLTTCNSRAPPHHKFDNTAFNLKVPSNSGGSASKCVINCTWTRLKQAVVFVATCLNDPLLTRWRASVWFLLRLFIRILSILIVAKILRIELRLLQNNKFLLPWIVIKEHGYKLNTVHVRGCVQSEPTYIFSCEMWFKTISKAFAYLKTVCWDK